MSFNLWRYLLEDDVDNFRQYLAHATFDRGAAKTGGVATGHGFKIGSPGTLSTSPKTSSKQRKSTGVPINSGGRGIGTTLTRADINGKDAFGRTLLHHAASSRNPNALEFVRILLDVPFLDLYSQDVESGWTALHRALYFGNISIAQALMLKDIQNATDYTTSASHVHAGGLVKIKDHEGNSPFEVFGLTIAPRALHNPLLNSTVDASDVDSINSMDFNDDGKKGERSRRHFAPTTDLRGDEVFAFGSNKNLTLGVGDEDDRHFPEHIRLTRPPNLLQHLYEDHIALREKQNLNEDLTTSTASLTTGSELPAIIQNHAIAIQNVIMSKLHTAVLTNDPISNLHICGFGPGGRLGTGDEATRFNYVCIQGGGLAKRKVVSIALGQDHSIAVCSSGEVFTWGINKYGQLGYELPEISSKEVPCQLIPRQLYGLIKKEQILGAAASSLHSAIFTANALYTFGKNEGQLGLMDADARSLEIQVIPRRVGVSIIQSPIQSVSAIDRATIVLLENHDVVVFTHFGWTRVAFPLESFTNSFVSEVLTTRYNMETNYIRMVTAGGNTICAMSSYGEVFTIDVPYKAEAIPPNKSTTNPSKARNALPPASKVWSIRKTHMAAIDAAVGQDGSIVLCTASGTVWKKEKRANVHHVRLGSSKATKPKDYKFVRIPNITRAIAVRSNAFGAFMAIRKDCDVTKEQISVQPSSLWSDLFALLAFHDYGMIREDENTSNPEPRFWNPSIKSPSPALIKRALLGNQTAEDDLSRLAERIKPLNNSGYDAWITSNVTEVRLPVHCFILKARSKVLRKALSEFQETYYYSIPDLLAIEYGPNGQIQLQFQGADFITIANLVLYLYTDVLADVWHYTSKALHMAPRYRAIRQELMKIASGLDLRQLERAVRVMVDPVHSMKEDFENAFPEADLYSDADVVIDLAEGEERYAHSKLLCVRCPFFAGLFRDRTGGMWMSNRKNLNEEAEQSFRVDLKHIDASIFELVLRHIYADTAEDIFDDIVAKDLDSFLDTIIEVMSVANELMLDRLTQVCQGMIGQFVTSKNICGFLNTIAESSVNDFKHAALEYICMNLENMLEQRLLQELDEYLVEELNQVVQENQLAYMPFARSSRAQDLLIEKYPNLTDQIEQSRQRRIDSMHLQTRLIDDEYKQTPKLRPRHEDDLPFDMDEDSQSPINKFSFETHCPYLDSVYQGRSRPVLTRLSSSEGPPDDSQSVGTETGISSLATTPRATDISLSANDQNNYQGNEAGAWSKSLKTSEKFGLRDIMEQASSSKVSNLTQSIQAAAVQLGNKPAIKLSQKERKRLQQEARLKESASSESAEKLTETAALPVSKSPSSPWQKITVQSQPVLTNLRSSLPPEGQGSLQASVKANMTLRQTVAGASAYDKREQPWVSTRSLTTPKAVASPAPVSPQIQSIRHTPLPARSTSAVDAHTSMADILAQQQIEKFAVKEAVAKRSLQEIQQEQEFQEWWDQESRRVQEEEAAVNTSTTGRSKGGRGGNRRKGPGRASAITSEQLSHGHIAQEDTSSKSVGTSEDRGRGQIRRSARGSARGGRGRT